MPSHNKLLKKIEEIKNIGYNKDEKIVSYSQYSKYQTCPHRWKLEYIDKHKFPDPNINLVFGTAMHEVIQFYLHNVYNKSVKYADENIDLENLLMFSMKKNYQKEFDKNGINFSTMEEVVDYYEDGCAILHFFKNNRSNYFNSRKLEYIGIEIPLIYTPIESLPNVKLRAYLDLIFYDKAAKRYKIIDIKTSKSGWNKWQKKDKSKTDQVLLYKYYFSKLYDIDIQDVDVEFFIVRRKIETDYDFPLKRIQEFKPADGSISINKFVRNFEKFITNSFTTEGYNKEAEYPAVCGEKGWNCTFCPFNEKENLCPKSKRITSISN